MPGKGSDYNAIKRVCDQERGIASQVVLARNFFPPPPAEGEIKGPGSQGGPGGPPSALTPETVAEAALAAFDGAVAGAACSGGFPTRRFLDGVAQKMRPEARMPMAHAAKQRSGTPCRAAPLRS